MSNPIDVPGQVHSSTLPSHLSGQSASLRANFRGESITHSRDPIAALQDAAEELTFAHSEKVEKKLAKRKINSKGLAKSFAMEQAEKYLRQVPDLERNKKLDDFAKAVLENSAGMTPETLRQRAQQFSGDETHQFLALSYTHEKAKEDNASPELIASLEQAMTDLQAEAGPAIQAGLNVSVVAEDFSAKGIGDTQQLRDFYRDVVLDYASVNDAYNRIVGEHSDDNFLEAVSFLLKSLAVDLDAGNHSLDKVKLKQIMDDMYQLKLLNSMHSQCEDLLVRVRHNFDAVPERIGTNDLMKELLVVQDKAWQGGTFFSELPHKLGILNNTAEIYFLQGFKEITRLIPLKVFNDDQIKRERLLQSVQQALDIAIDNEPVDG